MTTARANLLLLLCLAGQALTVRRLDSAAARSRRLQRTTEDLAHERDRADASARGEPDRALDYDAAQRAQQVAEAQRAQIAEAEALEQQLEALREGLDEGSASAAAADARVAGLQVCGLVVGCGTAEVSLFRLQLSAAIYGPMLKLNSLQLVLLVISLSDGCHCNAASSALLTAAGPHQHTAVSALTR